MTRFLNQWWIYCGGGEGGCKGVLTSVVYRGVQISKIIFKSILILMEKAFMDYVIKDFDFQ